jgi:hypothetical protein
MIFLSAQPDDYQFLWQLELQLYNLHLNNVSAGNIHILIGYKSRTGLRPYYAEFIEKYKHKASIFCYPDNRKKPAYKSGIRPHLIKQHIDAWPELMKERIFYHDSDVLFNNITSILSLPNNTDWYVSDTRSYLSAAYIISTTSEQFLESMCRIVGIDPAFVKQHDENAGGAQYILTGTDFQFWNKVEQDCEQLFSLMEAYNCENSSQAYRQSKRKRSELKGIQAWCADMWAILWNAWNAGHEVKIHSEMNFCWPKDPLEKWRSNNMLHYSGVQKSDKPGAFHKASYFYLPPYFDDLAQIDKTTCSHVVVEHIRGLLDTMEKIDLSHTSFCIHIYYEESAVLQNSMMIINYINKYLFTTCYILDHTAAGRLCETFTNCTCIPVNQPGYNTADFIAKLPSTFVIIYDPNVIVPIEMITEAIEALKTNKHAAAVLGNKRLLTDRITRDIFQRSLDDRLLLLNSGKFIEAGQENAAPLLLFNKHIYTGHYNTGEIHKNTVNALFDQNTCLQEGAIFMLS